MTIWAGTNDVCTSTTAGMTSVSSFSFSLQQTLQQLNAGPPGRQIYVLSIPDWFGFWQKFQANSTALNAWSAFPNRCPDLLSASATPADRAAVAQRISDLNTAIANVCSAFSGQCSTDGGATYALWSTLAASDFTFDFFHLSTAGQAKVATTSWNAGPWIGPSNTSPPTIGGTAAEGSTLTVADGTWSVGATSFDYQWRRCDSDGSNCVNIGGATANSYVLQTADVGTTIRAVVTASNSAGAFTAVSSAPTVVVTPSGGGGGSFFGRATSARARRRAATTSSTPPGRTSSRSAGR